MNKSKKKKEVPVEPLQEPSNPMSCCDPAAPQVETFDERVSRVTGSMSPGKSRVTRLYMEMLQRDETCRIYRKCKRLGYANAKLVKEKMRADRRFSSASAGSAASKASSAAASAIAFSCQVSSPSSHGAGRRT